MPLLISSCFLNHKASHTEADFNEKNDLYIYLRSDKLSEFLCIDLTLIEKARKAGVTYRKGRWVM